MEERGVTCSCVGSLNTRRVVQVGLTKYCWLGSPRDCLVLPVFVVLPVFATWRTLDRQVHTSHTSPLNLCILEVIQKLDDFPP